MVNSSPQGLDNKAKIEILLKEYEMLRNEIVNRINSRFAVVGYVAGLVAFIGTQSELPAVWVGVIAGLSVVMLLIIWWRFGYLIKRCTVRIAEIEQKVNDLAGEELLAWESRIAKAFIFHKFLRYRESAG